LEAKEPHFIAFLLEAVLCVVYQLFLVSVLGTKKKSKQMERERGREKREIMILIVA
jgi:hypothetical protein